MEDTTNTTQTILSFTGRNPLQNYIESSDGNIKYKIATTVGTSQKVTKIERRSRRETTSANSGSERTTIASVEWNYPNGDDILRFGGEDALPGKLKNWLRRRGHFVPLPGHTFTAPNGAQHNWIPHDNGIELIRFQLFNKSDMSNPIAVVRYAKTTGHKHHEIVLEPQAVEMLDTVIISLVLTLAEKFLMEQAFMDKATNAYQLNNTLFKRSRGKSSSSSRHRSSKSASVDDDDNASIYASSTTGLIRGSSHRNYT